MNHNKTSYDQLPIMLNANTIAQTLGISRAGAYELMHSKGFPTLRIGKRMMVSKDRFIEWIEQHSGEAI
jgi:excisionase family DNA binding protein